MRIPRALSVLLLLAPFPAFAQESAPAEPASKPAAREEKKEDKSPWKESTFRGLKLRNVGPALTSGRIGDIAVNPQQPYEWYVAVASGGLWKTTNNGTTWSPIFDDQPSFSIGCVTLDPKNPKVVWVGTGENNSQRSVSWGDGVYKSLDGGSSWKRMGLAKSEHIGKILIDPRNSQVAYVAAQGPLWSAGGERGLYKTTDGGESWTCVLAISEHTGVSDVVFDPQNPDVLYAAAYQRRRHVWTLHDGGPESAIHLSRDGGATWRKLDKGLPSGDVGRIGLAASSVAPYPVYATIELPNNKGGLYRTLNGGASWEKRSDTIAGSPQYYQEIFCDPKDADRLYLMDVQNQVSDDGGKTFRALGERSKHVDNHALWVDPNNTDHIVSGCDGGLYESFDRAATWQFKANLPVTQFYKICTDNAEPFYNVYGGTQDNFSLGGPSRTRSSNGITNAEWFITCGGDGFETQVDPTNPMIVYAQSQNGGIVRFDRASGERIDIQPQPGAGEEALRWNWDSPLLVSPHSPTRLYYAANRLFRTDDRGDSWRPVSPDLTRQIDRNTLPVMGKIWGIDAIAKHNSTSFYGNIVALSESPKREGLLYVGTDDGLIQVSEDGGGAWRKLESFPGVPERTYVSRLEASSHDEGVVYAAFDNHKNGDFKPYVLRSSDRGATWTSIASNLPAGGPVYALAEDPIDKNLLFAGTEYGVFFTCDGGARWTQLKGGMPTIAVRDLEIQKRESDLVVGTFGRGIAILEDFSPLRGLTPQVLEREATLFPVKRAWSYIATRPLGGGGKGFQGESFYAAANPPVGAVITYLVKEKHKTLKEKRQEAEKEAIKKGEAPRIPTIEELRAEEREEAPALQLTVRDGGGRIVRRIGSPAGAGMQRVTWDLREAAPAGGGARGGRPARDDDDEEGDRPSAGGSGPLVVPGKYTVQLSRIAAGVETALSDPVAFDVVALPGTTLPAADRAELAEFQRKVGSLQRAISGAVRTLEDAITRTDALAKAAKEAPAAEPALAEKARRLKITLQDLQIELTGDSLKSGRNLPTVASVREMASRASGSVFSSTSAPTKTHRDQLDRAAEAFERCLERERGLVEKDLRELEDALEAAGAAVPPGRLPKWSR